MTDIFQRYDDLKIQFADRDERHGQVAAVRRGDVHEVLPGLFPPNLPKQVTANMVNIASRQLGEQLGTLPDFSCKDGRRSSDTAKRQADKRSKISNYHVECSRLQTQMYGGADRYLSFGALPIVVEPNFEKNVPVMRVDSPVGAYWYTDLFGRVVKYFKCWYDTAESLAAKFPEHASKILERPKTRGGVVLGQQATTHLEVAKCYDGDYESIILPDKKIVLAQSPNHLGKTNVFLAEMPKWDEESRGQFDEMIWVQLFRARLAAFTMEIAHKAVNAPLVVPNDVNEISLGPNAIMRSNAGVQGFGHVNIDVPPAAFAENQLLANEERLAARFPEAATGNLDASVITGQGVSALLSTVDTQLQVAQSLFAHTLADAASHALEMDEVFFGEMEKTAEGRAQGAKYAIKYTPSKDIAGDYSVDATYGFGLGMDANRGLIFMLQGQGAGLLSRETIMDQLASTFGFNSTEEMERMDIEGLKEALKSGMQGYAASIPQMTQMGMDPNQAIHRIATLIKAVESGKPMHEAVAKSFEPTPQEQAAAEQQAQDPMAALPGGPSAPGGAPSAPGAPPGGGGPPDLMQMLAGLTQGGESNLQANVSRNIPTAA